MTIGLRGHILKGGLPRAADLQRRAGLAGPHGRRRAPARGRAGRSRPAALQVQAQALSRGRHRPQGLEDPEPAVPGVGAHREAPRREGDHPRPQEPRQEGRQRGHRHGLRPRGRAHRLRCPAPDSRGGRPRCPLPAPATPAFTKAEIDHAFANLVELDQDLADAGGVPPVHRPHLGRRPHALPHGRPLERPGQRALRRARADAHARPRGGARARAACLQAGRLLGDPGSGREGRRGLPHDARHGALLGE